MAARWAHLATLAALLLQCAAAAAAAAPTVSAADYAALAAGVGLLQTAQIDASQQYLLASGPMGIAAVGGLPTVTALKLGSGRAVVFGHEGMLLNPGNCCSGTSGLSRLIRNSAAWTAGSKASGVRLAATSAASADLVAALVRAAPARFVNAGVVAPGAVTKALADVLVANGQDAALGAAAAQLGAFVSGGGGLLIGAQAWWWSYSAPVELHPANLVLAPMGVLLAASSSASDVRLAPTKRPPQTPLECIEASLTRATAHPCYIADDEALGPALESAVALAAFMPQGSPFWATLARWAAPGGVPRPGINPAAPIARRSASGLAALARTAQYKVLPVAQLPAAPDATFFPRLPTSQPSAITWVTRTVQGTTQVTGNTPPPSRVWQSLGLYAAPGKPVTVRLPTSAVTALRGATLSIGGWTDRLYNLPTWSRLPDVVRQFDIAARDTTIGSALGGLIYLTLPPGLALGTLQVQVLGAVVAPVYSAAAPLTPAAWAAALSASHAPWGELGSKKVIIASPRASLATVANPAAVAAHWDRVADSHAWLAGIPSARAYPIRIQHDVQISAGYMNAGDYPRTPIMTFMDVSNSTLAPPPKTPASAFWGLYHEMGHTHQYLDQGAWTWGCTGEVSVNWFTARAMATLHACTPDTFYCWFGTDTQSRLANRQAYFASGPSHDKLCGDPALYLDSFLQLIEEGGFGWGLIRSTILRYRALPAAQLPAPGDNDAKLQFWVVQQSRAAGRDFSAYYRSWGWPVSDATAAALASLRAYPAPA